MRAARLSLPVAIAAVVFAASLTGCTTVHGCASWVHYDTPADAAADTDVVVVGSVVERDGSRSSMGFDHSAWEVDVAEWIVGAGPERISVVSLADTCAAGGPYGDGDPLEEAGTARVMLILRDLGGGDYSVPTPFQGVIVDPGGPVVPDSW